MAPLLYKSDESPPSRSVCITAEALGIDLQYEQINLSKSEQLTPEFLKLNPQHTVPTLVDDALIIWDSHAINIYLVTKYGKDDSLYPNDIYKRSRIDQRLHFDSGVLFPLIRAILRPMLYKGAKTIPENLVDETNEAYSFLEKFLEGHQWIAGDSVSIADFHVETSIAALNVLIPIDTHNHPNIMTWIERTTNLPYYRVNVKGHSDYTKLVKSLVT